MPINTLSFPKEIDKILLKLKIYKFKRLTRGTKKTKLKIFLKIEKNSISNLFITFMAQVKIDIFLINNI